MTERTKRCSCGNTDIRTIRDIGSDISVDGSEKQHIDICDKCQSFQMWCEFCHWDGSKPIEIYSMGDWKKIKDAPYLHHVI